MLQAKIITRVVFTLIFLVYQSKQNSIAEYLAECLDEVNPYGLFSQHQIIANKPFFTKKYKSILDEIYVQLKRYSVNFQSIESTIQSIYSENGAIHSLLLDQALMPDKSKESLAWLINSESSTDSIMTGLLWVASEFTKNPNKWEAVLLGNDLMEDRVKNLSIRPIKLEKKKDLTNQDIEIVKENEIGPFTKPQIYNYIKDKNPDLVEFSNLQIEDIADEFNNLSFVIPKLKTDNMNTWLDYWQIFYKITEIQEKCKGKHFSSIKIYKQITSKLSSFNLPSYEFAKEYFQVVISESKDSLHSEYYSSKTISEAVELLERIDREIEGNNWEIFKSIYHYFSNLENLEDAPTTFEKIFSKNSKKWKIFGRLNEALKSSSTEFSILEILEISVNPFNKDQSRLTIKQKVNSTENTIKDISRSKSQSENEKTQGIIEISSKFNDSTPINLHKSKNNNSYKSAESESTEPLKLKPFFQNESETDIKSKESSSIEKLSFSDFDSNDDESLSITDNEKQKARQEPGIKSNLLFWCLGIVSIILFGLLALFIFAIVKLPRSKEDLTDIGNRFAIRDEVSSTPIHSSPIRF